MTMRFWLNQGYEGIINLEPNDFLDHKIFYGDI
jgi:hypothetical protein